MVEYLAPVPRQSSVMHEPCFPWQYRIQHFEVDLPERLTIVYNVGIAILSQ